MNREKFVEAQRIETQIIDMIDELDPEAQPEMTEEIEETITQLYNKKITELEKELKAL